MQLFIVEFGMDQYVLLSLFQFVIPNKHVKIFTNLDKNCLLPEGCCR